MRLSNEMVLSLQPFLLTPSGVWGGGERSVLANSRGKHLLAILVVQWVHRTALSRVIRNLFNNEKYETAFNSPLALYKIYIDIENNEYCFISFVN